MIYWDKPDKGLSRGIYQRHVAKYIWWTMKITKDLYSLELLVIGCEFRGI